MPYRVSASPPARPVPWWRRKLITLAERVLCELGEHEWGEWRYLPSDHVSSFRFIRKRLHLERRYCVRCKMPDMDDLAWLDDPPTGEQQ